MGSIAALAGLVIGGARAGIPVLLDGFICGAAALVADRIAPGVRPYLIAGHRSVEPGRRTMLDALALDPLLTLNYAWAKGAAPRSPSPWCVRQLSAVRNGHLRVRQRIAGRGMNGALAALALLTALPVPGRLQAPGAGLGWFAVAGLLVGTLAAGTWLLAA